MAQPNAPITGRALVDQLAQAAQRSADAATAAREAAQRLQAGQTAQQPAAAQVAAPSASGPAPA
jgi:hypothetical protein